MEMFAVIKAYPGHADLGKWIGELRTALTPPPPPVEPTVEPAAMSTPEPQPDAS